MSSNVKSDDYGPSHQMEEMFRACLRKHKALNPDSPIDIYLLNLSKRVSQERFPSGRGHFADIYRGDLDNRIKVAIKMLRLPIYTIEDNYLFENAVLRFFRELSTWKELRHLNIARMFGFILADGNIGFVSSWYQHGNLVQYLKFNPEASKADLILDIAEGLEYLHSLTKPVIHADLKGLNVFINENGVACLGDFGISVNLGSLYRGMSTSSGIGSGTTPWMAPELFEDEPLFTRASDVYACAGVFLEVLCPGRSPYDYIVNETKLLMLKCNGEAPDRTRYPELSKQDYLWELLAECWVTSADARPDIKRVIRDLYDHFGLNPRVIKVVAHRPSGTVEQHQPQISCSPVATHSPLSPKESPLAKPGSTSTEEELRRHNAILELITTTEQHLRDIGLIESVLLGTRTHKPPIIRSDDVESFIHVVFSGLSQFQGYQKKLLQALYARQRQQGAIIWRIGDVLLESAEDFANAYPDYATQGLPAAEKRLKAEISNNRRFQALLVEKYSRGKPISEIDAEHIVNIPPDYLKMFCKLVEEITVNTSPLQPDFDDIKSALNLLQHGFNIAKLKSWQNSWMAEPQASWQWSDLAFEGFSDLPAAEVERQQLILELIRREMSYVNEFEDFVLNVNVDTLKSKYTDCAIRFDDVYLDHRTLVLRLHNMQLNEYASIRLVMGTLLDSGRDWNNLYKEYIIRHPHDWYDRNMRLRPLHDESGDISVTLVGFAIPRLRWYQKVFLPELERVTPQDHEDQKLIKHLADLLNELLLPLKPPTLLSKRRLELSKFLHGLEDTPVLHKLRNDANLDDEKRVVIHSEHLWELDTSRDDWFPVFLVLFDNCVVTFSKGYRKAKGWSSKGEITVIPTDHVTLNNPRKESRRVFLDTGLQAIFPFVLGVKLDSGDQSYSTLGTTNTKDRADWTDLLEAALPQASSRIFLTGTRVTNKVLTS